jgi:hypothetical protein
VSRLKAAPEEPLVVVDLPNPSKKKVQGAALPRPDLLHEKSNLPVGSPARKAPKANPPRPSKKEGKLEKERQQVWQDFPGTLKVGNHLEGGAKRAEFFSFLNGSLRHAPNHDRRAPAACPQSFQKQLFEKYPPKNLGRVVLKEGFL